MAKKKILFSAYSMDVGGIETALLTLLKYLAPKYDITLVLERKQGVFLEDVPSNVKIEEYRVSTIKFALIRKPINFIKELKFKLKYHNKFDFAASYATYSMPGNFIARTASKNSAIWVHNNYMDFFEQDLKNYIKFFMQAKVGKFKNVILVSELNKTQFVDAFPEYKSKAIECKNLLDYEKILEKSEEINDEIKEFKKSKKKDVTRFIHVGRHDEISKKVTRIIEATRRLNKEGYKFEVVLVGRGQDTKLYTNLSKDLKNIKFLGLKKNPYPYIKNSDCFILSSQTEGYPVVLQEAELLNVPIVTTDVSDVRKDIEGKFGLVVENSDDGVYRGMKDFMDFGFKTNRFDAEKFNQDIIKKLEKIING